jgi:hypothetical protein
MKSLGQKTANQPIQTTSKNTHLHSCVFSTMLCESASGPLSTPFTWLSVRDNLQLESEPVFAQEICCARSWE